MSIFRDLKFSLRRTYGALTRLILINVVIFLSANIIYNLFLLEHKNDTAATFLNWISLSSKWNEALLHFWTIPGYAFVHLGFLHIVSNMLMLYFMGRIFIDILGGARLVGVYLLGGIVGGILYLLVVPFFYQGSNQLVGASASVMAIVITMAVVKPDYTVFPFGMAVKLKWLAVSLFVLTSLFELSSNTGGKVAHIGGALAGYIYGMLLNNGKRPLERFMSLFSNKRRSALRVEHRQSASDESYNSRKTIIRRRIDEILDKISRSGYDSLNRDEREFLQKNHDKT